MVGIYQIRNTKDNKKYIGKSVNIAHRRQTHLYDLKNHRSNCRRLQEAYNNNPELFVFEIICECSKEELNEKEKYYINLYKTTDTKYGYNIESGGVGCQKTKETIKKLSESKKGNKSMCGIKLTDEWKKHLSESQPHKKKILCVETNVVYDSFADAARKTNLNRTKIVSCCTGKRKTTGGFHWEYYDKTRSS